MRTRKRSALVVLVFTCLVGTCGPLVGHAAAKSTVFGFTSTPSTSEAGGHPDVTTVTELGNRVDQGVSLPCECNDPENVTIHTPAGVIANPHVVSECTTAELVVSACTSDSQVGFVVIRVASWGVVPLYRVVPQAGQAALFAFLIPLTSPIPQYVAVNSRTGGDYGLDFRILGITHAGSSPFLATVFWGVPGESSHDLLRFAPGEADISCQVNPLDSLNQDVIPPDCKMEKSYLVGGGVEPKQPHEFSRSVEPFTQNPTTCVGPLASSIETFAYDGETDYAEAPWPETTGCDKLSFNPSLAAAPTTSEADSASGLAVDLRVPQFQAPKTPSPSEIRGSTITLPPGFTINPNAADGKTSCTDAQANFTNEEVARCPEFSKVGTSVLESSALPGPIDGYIYLGDPKPGDRYRIILTAQGFGTNVKIVGSVRPDPATGQLQTVFEDLPQSPFQDFNLHFFGSERGLLATPTQCGTYEVKAVFKPWAAELSDQTSTQFFTIDSGPGGGPCPNGPRPFDPSLQAGVEDSTAAAHSPFVVQIGREDGEQNLAGLTVKTPPGFSATLAGIPYCSEAAIARLAQTTYSGLAEQAFPACPAASQIGTAVAGAGAGTHPLYVPGKVYLAGPYKGAPLSLVFAIPALSGPFDLGVVAVRAAIEVDPRTAQVTVVSDPLPQIREGVRLRTRSIQVNLDRPGFTLNPTNCDPFSVDATVFGDQGAVASPTTHFQVANCADLPFAPKLTLRLSGSTKQAGNPVLTATLTAKPGEANLSRIKVSLPRTELIDNAHINIPCTRVQFDEGTTPGEKCPPGSILGFAKAETPLLDRPLEGPVYLRTGSHNLPDLVASLHGQIDIVLDGHVDSVHGRLRTTFETVPDAPVSKFTLHLDGGKKGLLENSPKLCAHVQHFTAALTGQNGKTAHRSPVLSTSCAKKHKRRARAHHNRRTHR